jgi:hypothetical protein
MTKAIAYILAAALTTTIASPLGAADELNVDVVLAMMARIPPEARPKGKPAGYDRAHDARAVAHAVAATANSREQAALMTVYAAYESAFDTHARGDCNLDRSYCAAKGAFQLWNVPPEVADDPLKAAPKWLALAADAEARCAKNPPDERLAVLASGSCDRARPKVRRRAETARAIVW